MLKVLSTKKLDALLVAEARNKGMEIIEQEAIQIRPLLSEEKKDEIKRFFSCEYVVFTSANAATIVLNYIVGDQAADWLHWKIFSLSGKTKDVLLVFPLFQKSIVKEAKNASALAKEIIACGVKEIVFFCGDKRREELPDMLKLAGIKTHEVVVYETVETPVVAMENIDAILFFSPSAANSFFSVNQLKETIVCFAVGETTAAAVAAFTNNAIITSPLPSQEALITTVQSYFNKQSL